MQSELLLRHRTAPLSVEVVWLPMLAGDSSQLIDRRVLSDPRVTYYWDPNRRIGTWFSSHVTNQPGITWDAFFLYGPDARWDSTPGPLLSSGSSVIGSREDLLAGFNKLEAASLGTGSG